MNCKVQSALCFPFVNGKVVTIIHYAGTSKNSDKCDSIWHNFLRCIITVVYEIIFFIFSFDLRNKEIVYQNNIAEKYYKIGRSELRWDI